MRGYRGDRVFDFTVVNSTVAAALRDVPMRPQHTAALRLGDGEVWRWFDDRSRTWIWSVWLGGVHLADVTWDAVDSEMIAPSGQVVRTTDFVARAVAPPAWRL